MPWELLRPTGLAALGLIVPLVALYVLKMRRERRVISSVWLWRAASRDLQAKSPFRKLLPSVPLFLELLALTLLALALASPVLRTDRLSDPRLVLIIDVSASMSAVDAGQTRLARAIGAARDLIAGLAPGTSVMVLAAGRTPELASPFEADPHRLRAALDRLTVDEVEGQLGHALAMASDQLRERGGGRIFVITDGAVADSDSLVAPNIATEVLSIAGASSNTAIIRTEVTRGADPVTGNDRVEVFAVLAHHSSEPREVFVTLSQRNVVAPLASRRVRLNAGEKLPVVLGFDAAPGDAGTGLTIELSPPDALTADDRSHGRVPAGRKLPVVLAPKKASVWIERALRADPDVELYAAELDGLVPQQVPEDALVVVDGACPERLPGADLLIVNPPQGPCRTVKVGAPLSRPDVTSWSETDARLRHLTFDGVEIARSSQLELERAGDALVRSQSSALIADVSSPGRNATVIGFDVGASNWPLKASFVLFVRNVVELARAHRTNTLAAPSRTGDPIRLRVPLDVDQVTVEYPNGRKEPVFARSGIAVLPPPTKIGFLQASWGGARPSTVLIPTSLSSEAESQIAPKPLPPGVKATAGEKPVLRLSEIDWLFALLALAFVALDVAWVTRRPREKLLSAAHPRAPTREQPGVAR